MDLNRTVITVTPDQFDDLQRVLAEPTPATDKLDALMACPDIFDKPFQPAP